MNAVATSQHLPRVFVPALPSGQAGAGPNPTSALATAGPQPLHSDASLLRDAEAKLFQAHAELDVTRSQLQVLDLVQHAGFDVCNCASVSTCICQQFCQQLYMYSSTCPCTQFL